MRRRHLISGSEAILEVYDDKVKVIEVNSSLRDEHHHSLALLYSALSGITFRSASQVELGHIIFHCARSSRHSVGNGVEPTFTFPLSENAHAEEVCAFINNQLKRSDIFTAAKSKLAVALQIKKLSEKLSAGELTLAEFENEKRKILFRP
jgi:hypothetical protein